MLRRRSDGRFDLHLDPQARDVIVALLHDLGDGLDADPGHPDLARLRPPAYLDDAERDAAYQLLAGDELRSSRRAAIDAVCDSMSRDQLTEAELWSWLQALNAVRLVVGTRLDIRDDDQQAPDESNLTDDQRSLWTVYHFTTAVQHEVVDALGR